MDLFKLVGTIAINNDAANKAIDGTTDKAEDAHSKINGAFSKAGDIALKAGKAVAVGIGAGVTALSVLGKQAIDDYADYEQLVGGVETLFKSSSDTVMGYANNAYKTAGLSANQYMEQVTSFSASMISSLDGDTAAAAEKSNQAITDMADNANKMGTNMEDVQNAYQGFAKQNYTMLDNLKLGYGGTQEEMQRLLDDAEKLTGQHYELGNFADMTDAIHAVQTEMGITGTTAEEAASTIQGSAGMMKASWENFLTGMADPSQNFDTLLGNLIDSVLTFADNIVPRIGMMLPRLVQGVTQLIKSLAGQIPSLLQQLIQPLIEGAVGLVQAVVQIAPELVTMIIGILPQLIEGMIQIFTALVEALPQLIDMIVAALPTLIPMLVNGCVQLVLALVENLPMIIQSLIDAIPVIIQSVVTALVENAPALIEGAVQLVIALVAAIPQIIMALIQAIPIIIQAIITGFAPVVGQLGEVFGQALVKIGEVFAGIGQWASDRVTDIQNGFASIGQWFGDTFGGAFDAIGGAFASIGSWASERWNDVCDAFNSAGSWFSDTFNDAYNGVTNAFSAVGGWFQDRYNDITGVFSGIGSFFADVFSGFKFPNIALPHFSISGSFSLNPPSIPTLGIDWYAKAMNQPMMFKDPTLFGMNPMTGNAMGAGEAGDEVMIGKNTMLNMMGQAVAEQNGGMVQAINDCFDKLFDILEEYFPEFNKQQLVLDTGLLVSEIAEDMDEQLGILQRRAVRA